MKSRRKTVSPWETDRFGYRLQSIAELRMSGVAACVLDALPLHEAAAALQMPPDTINAYILRLCVRYKARNQVALALALQREVWLETGSAS
jgi:hypothetical protein